MQTPHNPVSSAGATLRTRGCSPTRLSCSRMCAQAVILCGRGCGLTQGCSLQPYVCRRARRRDARVHGKPLLPRGAQPRDDASPRCGKLHPRGGGPLLPLVALQPMRARGCRRMHRGCDPAYRKPHPLRTRWPHCAASSRCATCRCERPGPPTPRRAGVAASSALLR